MLNIPTLTDGLWSGEFGKNQITPYTLITVSYPDDTIDRFTDAPHDINYIHDYASGEVIEGVNIPPGQSTVGQDLFSIAWKDTDGSIYNKYAIEEYSAIQLELGLVFWVLDDNGDYLPHYHIDAYHGRCSSFIRETTKADGRITLVTYEGELGKPKVVKQMVATHINQQNRNPIDRALVWVSRSQRHSFWGYRGGD